MHDNRRVHLTQRLEQLKVEYKRAESNNIRNISQKVLSIFLKNIDMRMKWK